jgi:hypothetical protein
VSTRVAAALVGAFAVALPPQAGARVKPQLLGSGAAAVWILPQQGPLRDVVVFGHGWSTPLPTDAFAAWIAHLRRLGSLVIYPRYEDTGTTPAGALAAFESGVVTAFHRLGPVHVPILALGKSFGGSAVFYYAAEAAAWHVPAPQAVVSIFPAYPIGALPPRRLPPSVYVRVLVGDRDTIAGSGGANAFWSWLAIHPPEKKAYVVIRSRPRFVADHDSAQRDDRLAQAIFWRPVDTLLRALTRARVRQPADSSAPSSPSASA